MSTLWDVSAPVDMSPEVVLILSSGALTAPTFRSPDVVDKASPAKPWSATCTFPETVCTASFRA
jgi:hypothetical protein